MTFTDKAQVVEQLMQNLQTFKSSEIPGMTLISHEDLRVHQAICKTFVNTLMDQGSGSAFLCAPGEESFINPGLFFVVQKPWEAPYEPTVIDGIEYPLEAPRLRKFKAVWSPEAVEDLKIFHGLDATDEIASAIGFEMAIEVHAEIRQDARNGNPVKAYCLFTPPYAAPTVLEPETFTLRRYLMLRYSKINQRKLTDTEWAEIEKQASSLNRFMKPEDAEYLRRKST